MARSATLFDQRTRSDRSPARHAEGSFPFLNRVAGPYWGRVRKAMETWFASYPSASRRDLDAKADLRARFRSRDNRSHRGAFWEHYQAEALRRSGYSISPNPDVPGTTRTPDFLAGSPKGGFYVEATVASVSDAEDAANHRRAVIYDVINAIPSPNFFLWMDVKQEGEGSPDTRRLRREIMAWLGALDPDAVIGLGGADRIRAQHLYRWSQQGWIVHFWPIPKSEGHRGRGGPTIGLYPTQVGYVDSTGPLRAALREKATRYGIPDKPYVVAVLIEDPFIDHEDLLNSLFGSIAVQVAVERRRNGSPDHRVIRLRDGAWTSGRGPINTRVSAVVTAINLGPAFVATQHAPAPRLGLP